MSTPSSSSSVPSAAGHIAQWVALPEFSSLRATSVPFTPLLHSKNNFCSPIIHSLRSGFFSTSAIRDSISSINLHLHLTTLQPKQTIMSKTPDRELLRLLPKCEHHMHLEGALSPEVLFELAAKNNITLPADDENFKSAESLNARYKRYRYHLDH